MAKKKEQENNETRREASAAKPQVLRLSDLQRAAAGMCCRDCGCRDMRTIETRPDSAPGVKLRVKACRHCGRRFLTRETLAYPLKERNHVSH